MPFEHKIFSTNLKVLDAVRDLCPDLVHHHVELPQDKLRELDLESDLVVGADPLLHIGVVLQQS